MAVAVNCTLLCFTAALESGAFTSSDEEIWFCRSVRVSVYVALIALLEKFTEMF